MDACLNYDLYLSVDTIRVINLRESFCKHRLWAGMSSISKNTNISKFFLTIISLWDQDFYLPMKVFTEGWCFIIWFKSLWYRSNVLLVRSRASKTLNLKGVTTFIHSCSKYAKKFSHFLSVPWFLPSSYAILST